MACTGRYAEAWEFASFWCVGPILTGVDNSGGAGNAFLTDTWVDFTTMGAVANQGMYLYNTTQATHGQITAVTASTLTATGVLWDDGDAYRTVFITAAERSAIEHYLNVAAGDIHAARAAAAACDCVLAGWAADYLSKLNIIDAAAYHTCKCGKPALSEDERMNILRWADEQLGLIRTGNIELCHGETGADFPAIGWAEQSLTDFATAQIIVNYQRRNQ